MVVKVLNPSIPLRLRHVFIFAFIASLVVFCHVIITAIFFNEPVKSDYIRPQTAWREKSKHRAPQCLDVIEQEHADRIDWDFIVPQPEPPSLTSYIRYGSPSRIEFPLLSTDPRYTPFIENNGKAGKVVFINGHAGTKDDFAYMTHQLGIKYTEFNPRDYWFYGLNASLVDYWNHKRNLGEFFCRTYDTVVVGDTITDSRFLLQWIDEISVSKAAATAQETGTRLCKIKKILMMTTNRFDFAIKKDDLPDYHNLLKRVTRLGDQPGRKFPKIIWMANNPFDIQYVKVALGDWVKFKLIRSFGYSTLPAVQLLPKHVTELPAVYNHYDESRFIGWLKRNDIEVSVLKRNYGGPTSLSQFRAFIDFPYQASTMKMYENLLYGVVTLAPSKRLFVNDLEGYIIEGDRVPGWQDYVEYWYDDMKDYVYIFDTIEELREILKKPEIDTRGIRERGESIWKELNKQSLSSWSKVLKQ